jgi:hypothetical protein
MTGCELLSAPNSSTSSSATSGASQHFCWQLNLRPGIHNLPRHEPAPHPVRTEIHVLDFQTHGLAVQAYPSRAIFPSGTMIAHSHFSPRNPHASCLGLANFRVLKYNLHWLSEPSQGDSRSYGSPSRRNFLNLGAMAAAEPQLFRVPFKRRRRDPGQFRVPFDVFPSSLLPGRRRVRRGSGGSLHHRHYTKRRESFPEPIFVLAQ